MVYSVKSGTSFSFVSLVLSKPVIHIEVYKTFNFCDKKKCTCLSIKEPKLELFEYLGIFLIF